MIITLTGAKFDTNKVGTLSTWAITTRLGTGATYNGVRYVDKNSALNATVTLTEGYDVGSDGVTVTMGGSAVSGAASVSSDGRTVTITIDSVTGNIEIKVPTVNTSTGEEDGGSTETTSYTVTYKYVDGSGNTIKASTTESVTAGTSKTFSTSAAPAISGYTVSSVSPTGATINSDTIVTYTYNVISGDGTTTTTTYTNAGYVLQSSGALTGASSTWVHSDFIPISSLADGDDGKCVKTFVGHGTVAAIAFYTTKDDYTSYTEGYILSNTSANATSQSVAQVTANITDESAQYVVFSTDGSKATLEVTTYA